MSLFLLTSHLLDEPCGLFLLSIIVARNYDAYFALPGVRNKQIESSINLINKLANCLKSGDLRDKTLV